MNADFTSYNKSILHYRKSGSGKNTLIAFHGFGQDLKAFDTLVNSLSDQYIIYTFDLYFHGKSEWGYGEQPLERCFWKDVMQQFLTENNIEKFSVTGFSIGCRFALATTEDFAGRIEKLYLLAPDGVKTSFWYFLSTYPVLFRKIFKKMIGYPGYFQIITRTLRKTNLTDRSLLNFVERQMDTREKRRRLYYTWVVLRHLTVNLNQFISIVNMAGIPVITVIGKSDAVISPSAIRAFTDRIKNSQFIKLDSGHVGILKDASLKQLFSAAI